MSSLLIEELQPTEGNLIIESVKDKNGKNKVCLKGIFMQADLKNRNGRNYPLSEISTAVQNAADVIKTHGGIYGELDHPQTLRLIWTEFPMLSKS